MKRQFRILLLALIFIGYSAYAFVFIQQSLFEVEGQLYAALFDDAMISMSYARSLAQGSGLVWYPGAARVEGFSNPLWVGFMALIHLLPLPQRLVSLPVMAAGALFMLGCLFFLYKIADRLFSGRALPTLLTVFLAAFYYPLSNWSLLGTEVSLLLMITAAGIWLALRSLDEGRVMPGLYFLLAASTLVRLDMGVLFVVIWGWSFLFDRRNRWRHLAWGAGTLIVFLGAQTAFRLAYYGEWLPMTYHLKMAGVPLEFRLLRGYFTLQDFIGGLNKWLFFFSLTALLWRRERRWLLVALALAAQLAYSVYVGGDAWEHRGGANRFIALGMPFYWLLLTAAGYHLVEYLALILARGRKSLAAALAIAGRAALVVFTLLALLRANFYQNEGSLKFSLVNPKEGSLRYALLQQRSFFVPGSERYARDGLILRDLTTPNARIAVTAAGNSIYFAGRPGVDMFGKCDPTIAKMPARLDLMSDEVNPTREDLLNLRPGHSKWLYSYSIGELQPDVVVEVFPSTTEEAASYLAGYIPAELNGHTIYFKTGSANVLWDKLQ